MTKDEHIDAAIKVLSEMPLPRMRKADRERIQAAFTTVRSALRCAKRRHRETAFVLAKVIDALPAGPITRDNLNWERSQALQAALKELGDYFVRVHRESGIAP
jgi:hypothetical protein